MLFFKERQTTSNRAASSTAFGSAFNTTAADLKIAQLTQDMTQAFYRREHETIENLAAKGAKFTEEMLQTAVAFRDHHLADKCLMAGVLPNEDMVKRAAAQHDAPLVDLLIRKIELTADLKTHIEAFTSEAVQKICAPHFAHLRTAPVPPQSAHHAQEYDPPKR